MEPCRLPVLLVLLWCLAFGHGAKFLLTVPKQPHLDTEYIASVTAYGITPGSQETVILEYRGKTDTSRVINRTRLTFTEDETQTWTVVFPMEKMQEYGESAVRLLMINRGKEENLTLSFSDSTGYIFIQTDKPIYTPRQTVKFRVIAVDENQQLAKYPLVVDVKNEADIIVDRIRYSAEDAFKAQEFELPRETPPGVWTISAKFEGMNLAYSAMETVEFEVREYVLPRFSATVSVKEEVITKVTTWLTINVAAEYVYGKEVFGSMEMQLGIWDSENGATLFRKKYYCELKNGQCTKYISRNELFPDDMPFPQNKRLYVAVNVTESSTLENATVVDTNTFIAHPYYVVNYENSRSSFKPGFPYILHTTVMAQSQTPASWMQLYVKPTYYDENNYRIKSENGKLLRLDADGKVSISYDTSEIYDKIHFLVIVITMETGFSTSEFEVRKRKSPSNTYLQLSMMQDIKSNTDGVVNLKYTAPAVGNPQDKITVRVLAKGHVIYTTSTDRNPSGISNVIIPKSLYGEASPSMRIVAFFFVSYPETEFVIDSLYVDTPDVCMEEVKLLKPGGILGGDVTYEPKEHFPLTVEGKAGMRVGLVAMDKAVSLLNNKLTLTRESMFTKLDSHDQGTGTGDGDNLKEIIENSGLHYMLVDNEAMAWSNTGKLTSTLHDFSNEFLHSFGAVAKEGLSVTHRRELPPHTVRHYFPESWMFFEQVLPQSNTLTLNLTLPDSITTWKFMAVGLSANRGVCVTHPVEQKVQKLFFADVKLPYKVTRLEEVKVKIAVYNFQMYPLQIKATATGSDGICFSSNSARGQQQANTTFEMRLGAKESASEVIKIIPLKNGDLDFQVELRSQREIDVVQRKIHVVAEGRRVRKSITFVLDPEAKHTSFKAMRKQRISLIESATINNKFDVKKKQQMTTIDLALPREVIRGSEFCRISAFGDLMGDIITHAIVQSKSLVDQPVMDAEEVLGDLGPTVNALLYVNESGLMSNELQERGRRFVRHNVARLLKYRKGSYFVLTPDSKPATWLTSFVLKSLCQASSLAYIDRANLIDDGFNWLFYQIDENSTFSEQDWRLAKDSHEYKIMLAADVLISILECNRNEQEGHLSLQALVGMRLEESIAEIQQPMVMAKVAYALTLLDDQQESTIQAVRKLDAMKRRNKLSQFYWSDKVESDEDSKIPFWYHEGAKASSIEATAYALLVFLKHGGTNVDAIADWLVAQRSASGAFIGAMDSTAAIQALSKYSRQKHGLEVNLHCNVGSDRLKEYSHSFSFTEKNATTPESLNNVPVGQVLQVLTVGQGLGQMQVNVEYNVPIEKNKNCPFNITVNIKPVKAYWTPGSLDSALCSACDIGCVNKENLTTTNSSLGGRHVIYFDHLLPKLPESETKVYATLEKTVQPRSGKRQRSRTSRRQRKNGERKQRKQRRRRPDDDNSNRNKRSTGQTRSKHTICLHICLQHQHKGVSNPIQLEVEMLTGYRPREEDYDQIKTMQEVRDVQFDENSEKLIITVNGIQDTEPTCFGLRAFDELNVGRLTPSSVTVREKGNPYEFCSVEYEPVTGQESLQVHCADISNINRGECRCFSGLCSKCAPFMGNTYNLNEIKQLACDSPIAYQLTLVDVKDLNQWMEIEANVVSVNKSGIHEVTKGDIIKMTSPSSCYCLLKMFSDRSERFYMLSADVEKMVNRYGNIVYQYLLDEKSVFLRVSEPQTVSSLPAAIAYDFLALSLKTQSTCPA